MSSASTINRNPIDRELARRTRAQTMAWLCLGCRLALGGLFVLAATMKLQDPQGFADAIQGFKIVPDHIVKLLAFALPWTELIAGVLLILGVWTGAASLLIVLLLAGFIAGIVSVLARDLSTTCACFGKLEFPCGGEVGLCQIVRNAVLIGLAVPLLVFGPGKFSLDRAKTSRLW